MPPRLPSLNALRAFDAAARHLNFTRAAEDLHVTAAAVSHQVRALEAELGVRLFVREGRTLRLTQAGAAGLPRLRDGFDALAEAAARMRGADDSVLTLSVAPSFAASWLIPRLDRFRAAHPGLSVRLDARMDLVDFARDDVDAGIRFGSGRYPGLAVTRLTDETFLPVCAPGLLAGRPPLDGIADLLDLPLLHIDWPVQRIAWVDWDMWFRALGHPVTLTGGTRFGDSVLFLHAALSGQGVALMTRSLASEGLARGDLVRPVPQDLPVPDLGYFLVHPESAGPKVGLFRAWLLDQARESGLQSP